MSTKSSREGKTPDADERWVVNRSEFAELLGVHPDTITEYARQGMPSMRDGRGKSFDLRRCLPWWRERQGRQAEVVARTRAFNATAELNELKLQREHGSVLRRDEVVRDGQAYTKAWATQVQLIPRRARNAGVVTAEGEAGLKELCRQLLIDISSWKTRGDAERASATRRRM